MELQITDFGVSTLNAAGGPVALEDFKLGSAYNYVATTNQSNIQGSQVFAGDISPAVVVNANVVKYSCYLDYDVGNFDFGEIGLYYQGQLFAIGVNSKLINKIRNGLGVGNSIRIDVFLTFVGANYGMWIDVAETKNNFRMASLHSPDQLPPSDEAVPNAYIISGASSDQVAFIAYTDRNGLWNFDTYQYATASEATIVDFDNKSVTISLTEFEDNMVPSYFGEVILEFATGNLYSICRYIKTTVVSGTEITLGFETNVAQLPSVGDKILVYRRAMGAASIPIATTTTLGVVKIGSGIKVDPDGTIYLDGSGNVISVNGKGGVVILTAADIPGISTVGKTGDYNDLLNKPDLTLPTMSTSVKGGAKLPTNNNLVINGDVLDLGFDPIKTINSQGPDADGNLDIFSLVTGLVNPTAIPASANLNTYSTTGLFTASVAVAPTLNNCPITTTTFALEVVPMDTGLCVQRISNGTLAYWRKKTGASTWSAWVLVATNAVATATSVGVVKIGDGLSIDLAGKLTTWIASTSTPGIVQIGAGLAVDGTGLLSVDIPFASTDEPGLMQVGAGLAVDTNGVVSVDTASLPIATTSVLGVIKVGTGLSVTADGVLSVNPTNIAVATTSSLGVVKIGPGIVVAPDGTISVSANSLPIATTSARGVVQVGQGLSVSAGGILSSNLRTVNGNLPDASGNVNVTATAPADPNKLDKVNGIAVGVQLQFNDLGSKAGGTNVSVNTSSANVMAVTFTGGAGNVNWSFTGWPATGTYAEVQMEIINGGLATHTFPAAVKFIMPDGTIASSFAACVSSQRSGMTNFQNSGTDFVVFWTRNGGATIWAKLL